MLQKKILNNQSLFQIGTAFGILERRIVLIRKFFNRIILRHTHRHWIIVNAFVFGLIRQFMNDLVVLAANFEFGRLHFHTFAVSSERWILEIHTAIKSRKKFSIINMQTTLYNRKETNENVLVLFTCGRFMSQCTCDSFKKFPIELNLIKSIIYLTLKVPLPSYFLL